MNVFSENLLFLDQIGVVRQLVSTPYTTWIVKNDGTLWGCGYGGSGCQGNGGTSNVTSFTQRLTNVSKVFCSPVTTFTTKNDGTIWCCGTNNVGQLGEGSTSELKVFTEKTL